MTIPEDQNWPRVKIIGLYGLSRAHHEVNRRSFTAILLIYSNDMKSTLSQLQYVI